MVTTDKGLSVKEVATRLGVHPNTVRNAIETEKIQATKVLGRWRIKQGEVQRILDGKPLEGWVPRTPTHAGVTQWERSCH